VPVEKDEPLKLELRDFIRCIQLHQTPKVSGAAAKRALDLALEITRQIQAGNAGR
jgi:predicted dehydrogenase